MAQSDENGFVKRGIFLLAGMTVLVAVVLSMILYKPAQPLPAQVKDLPAQASAPGCLIRYNATVALLRRGSDNVPWPIVREMLDEKQQLKNSEFAHPESGRTIPDESQARSFVITGLKAVAQWRRVRGEQGKPAEIPDRTQFVAELDALAQSPIPELKIQAEKTRQAVAGGE